MNIQSLCSRTVISMMVLAFLHLPCSAERTQRENVLEKHFPESLAGLSEKSRNVALKYVAAWMTSMSSVSVIGLQNPDRLKGFYEKEFLPILLPLKDGDKAERDAFAAGVKIYEAVHHLALKLTDKTHKEDSSLEELVRYKPGNEHIGGRLSNGLGQLCFDYMQMVAPDFFEKTYLQYQARQQ